MVTLDSVALLSDQKQKIEQYRTLLYGILASGSRGECEEFVDHSMLPLNYLPRAVKRLWHVWTS
jgi:hypothetical protein